MCGTNTDPTSWWSLPSCQCQCAVSAHSTYCASASTATSAWTGTTFESAMNDRKPWPFPSTSPRSSGTNRPDKLLWLPKNKSSKASLRREVWIAVTLTSTEPIKGRPQMYIADQPRMKRWLLRVTKCERRMGKLRNVSLILRVGKKPWQVGTGTAWDTRPSKLNDSDRWGGEG